MDLFQILTILIFLSATLVGIAQKLGVPYPVMLVLGGIAIGFIPGFEPIYFDPNLILIIVLPPILYSAAFLISFHEFKDNWREIFSLALGLVALTTFVVALLFKWLFPHYSWGLAFAFGAIVSPPDSVAATTILKRFSISPRLLTILEGESLINDASALVLYKLAIASIFSGAFSWADASLEFVKVTAGGTVVGLLCGIVLQHFSRRFLDSVTAVLFSFTIPYVTFVIAQYFDVSGVLAVVVCGLIGSRLLATHPSARRRVLGFAFWDLFTLFMNCFIFILIGLQLRKFVNVMTAHQIALYVAYACLITLVLILIRLIWVYTRSGFAYYKAVKNPPIQQPYPKILQEATLLGWAGMRGIVSLTAAIAIPYISPFESPIEGRNEAIFITFVVILITLLLPSTTLPSLIHWMKLEHREDHQIVHHVRKILTQVAKDKVAKFHHEQQISEKEYQSLIQYFTSQRYIHEISHSTLKKLSNVEKVRLKVFQAQRNKLIRMWENQEIDDRLFRQLEHELDVEESHTTRAELT